MQNPRQFLAEVDTSVHELVPRLRIFLEEYERYRSGAGARLRVLDVGCGREAVLWPQVAETADYVGCDFPPRIDAPVPRYVGIDLNEASLADALAGEEFDVVFCGEVIEHLFSPDALLEDVARLLAPGGVLILSTPNLAYYVNRLLLLAGISPLFLENSSRAKLGRKTRLLGQGNPTEGHIRVFTYSALRELVAATGYEVVRARSSPVWSFPLDRLVCRIAPRLGPDTVLVLRRSYG